MNELPRRISRRLVLRLAAGGASVVAISSVFAACGGGTAPSSVPTTAAPAAAAAPTNTPAAAAPAAAAATNTPAPAAAAAAPSGGSASIKLSVWPDVADLQIASDTIAGFKKVDPSITVAPEQWVGDYYQKLQVGIAGGTVPDMVYFQGWRWQQYALGGQVVDLSDRINTDKASLPSDLFPANLDAYNRQSSLKGKHYGMPVDTGSMVMYYNKDLFDAAGVAYPKDTWTQQDWLDTVQKVQGGLKKAGKSDIFAYQPNYNDPYVRDFRWWRANGGSEYDSLEDPKKATWDNPAIAEAWQRELFDLSKQGVAITQAALVSGGGSSAYYTFGIQNGLAAMKMEGPWFLPQMWGDKAVTKGGLKFDVVQMPKGSTSSSSFWQVEPITIWKTSKSPDACWSYLKYAVADEAQGFVAKGGRMTNTPTSIAKLWAPLAAKLYNFENAKAFAAADGASMVSTGGISTDQMALQGGLNDARDAVINGSKTAKDALAAANQQIQALLDQWWKDNPNS
jgi:multiple sugar transport system substrate-binding protein